MFCGYCNTSIGQTKSEIPQKFIQPLENIDYSDDKNVMEGTVWTVFSDRPYNKTYTKAKGSDVKFIIDFLSQFYVMDRKGNKLNIYKLHEESSDSLVDYGWIDMDNLLLWNYCLETENIIKIKSILVESPKTKKYFDIKTSNTSTNFDIFYVYKINDNSVLVGNKPSFAPNKVKDCIIAWIPKDDLYIWRDAIAIEPIFCNASIDVEFCIPEHINFFLDKRGAKKFAENFSFNKKSILNLSRIGKSWDGSQLRYPLTSLKENIAEVILLNDLHLKDNSIEKSFIPGYVPIIGTNVNVSLFNIRYLFSGIDFARISVNLKILSSISDKTPLRKRIYFSWIEILKNEYFEKEEDELNNKTIGELHKYFFKKQITMPLNPDIMLSQLLDSALVSDQNIEDYYNKINVSYNKINKILNSNIDNNITFSSNGILYYWINSNTLP